MSIEHGGGGPTENSSYCRLDGIDGLRGNLND
jgi:hypothetical protein